MVAPLEHDHRVVEAHRRRRPGELGRSQPAPRPVRVQLVNQSLRHLDHRPLGAADSATEPGPVGGAHVLDHIHPIRRHRSVQAAEGGGHVGHAVRLVVDHDGGRPELGDHARQEVGVGLVTDPHMQPRPIEPAAPFVDVDPDDGGLPAEPPAWRANSVPNV